MQAKWETEKVLEKFSRKVDLALTVVGAQGVTLVAKKIRSNGSIVSSYLVNSVSYATEKGVVTPAGGSGGLESLPSKGSVRVGMRVAYAARVNFGFVGTDSLGRTYNQPAKPFMIALEERKDLLNKIFSRAMKNG